MPFCPDCAFEYSDGMSICPECKIPLADRPPGRVSSAVRPDASWVKVCRLDDRLASDMVRGLLNSNNIPSMFMSSSLQPLGTGVGWFAGHRMAPTEGDEIVLVPREFRQEAELLLAAVLGDDLELFDAPSI